jgi:hypothetical protein
LLIHPANGFFGWSMETDAADRVAALILGAQPGA